MNVHFMSQRLDWQTPDATFHALDKEFDFQLDVCATAENAKCRCYFSPEDDPKSCGTDGLSQSWLRSISGQGTRCWMNPPYGREIGKWMAKAHDESMRRGNLVVCLVPSRTDTRWWHDYAMKATEIRFIKGRLKFEGSKWNAPFPSAIVVFKKAEVR